MRLLWLLLLLIGCCDQGECQIVQLTVSNDRGELGKASAICIGPCEGGSVFLTARHNFDGATKAKIQLDGRWIRVRSVNESRRHDCASFEAECECPSYPVATAVRTGQRVRIGGYGPEYWGSGKASYFWGVVDGEDIQGDGGQHPIQGDSGGPVIADDHVVGVVCGYVATVARTDHSARRPAIVFCGPAEITECLHQVYQRCPPSGCQIYLRPQVQQPMVGIGIPIGPPRVVGVATPVPKPPQVYQPVPRPEPIMIQGPPGPLGERGAAGPQGPPGRSVSREDLEAVVHAWLDANRDALRGADGRDGAPGPAGSPGPRGPAVETPIRVILANDGRFMEEKTYPPGEPIVLDVKRLRSVSDGQ